MKASALHGKGSVLREKSDLHLKNTQIFEKKTRYFCNTTTKSAKITLTMNDNPLKEADHLIHRVIFHPNRNVSDCEL